jgi:hypothetical protein
MVTADPLPDWFRAADPGLRLPCHFGEWLQGRLGREGPVALVTLMPRLSGMRAHRQPGPLAPCRFGGGSGRLSLPLMRRFLQDLGMPVAGRFHLRPGFVPGSGTGMSTASLLAVAALAGYRGSAMRLAQACVAAEGASDPLMFRGPDRLLWASREARLMSVMPPPPRAHLLAGFWGPPEPTRARDNGYADITDLVRAWAHAPDLARCAALASESAARCQALRGPLDDPTAQLARDLGALGWARSHSGPARALIFAPGELPQAGVETMRAAGLRDVRLMITGSR